MTVLIAAVLACGAFAADPFYLGAWKITSAVVAPWADSTRQPDAAEQKTLVGKLVVFRPKEIIGPRQVACKGPNYQVKDYPADMLFEGAFGEMHARDKSVDPVKVVATVGFQGRSWKTLETGCATELDFHFADQNTAAFGLNNFVYLLKKQ